MVKIKWKKENKNIKFFIAIEQLSGATSKCISFNVLNVQKIAIVKRLNLSLSAVSPAPAVRLYVVFNFTLRGAASNPTLISMR